MSPSSIKRILVVDDERQILSFLDQVFRSAGWEVATAESGAGGIECLERGRYDVILTDLKMPGADGLEVLRTARKLHSDAEVVLMTGYGTVDTAIEAMRAGAFHYLTKPFKADEVIHLVDKAYAQRRLKRENLFLKAEARGRHQIEGIIGTSAAVQELVSAVQRLADTETPVLLEGERGTGRAFIARVIHFHSSRAGGLFVPAYCAGAEADTLESDLFGHAAGAYERAVLPRSGKLEMANHGTVYLADIGEAGPEVQERILALLTEKTITPVGSGSPIELDVRLVASSASGLDGPVRKGKFLGPLRDLLAPGAIRIPSLRERAEDVPLLLHHFLFEANRDRKKPLRGFSEAAVAALTAYPWPGNARELMGLVRSIAARKKQGTVVDASDIPPDILYGRKGKRLPEAKSAEGTADIADAIVNLEKPMVMQALALTDGDRERAAGLLNIDLPALRALMRRHGIE